MARTFVKLGNDRFLRISANGLLTLNLTPLPTATLGVVTETVTEGVTANFLVSLSAAATADITVDYTTVAGTGAAGVDYLTTSGTLTFTAGATSMPINVPTIVRTGTQGTRTFSVTISNAETVPGESLTIVNATSSTSIGDAVEAPVAPTLSIAAVAAANEGATLTFRVTASDTPQEGIVVTYASSDGSATAGVDYTAVSGSVRLAIGVSTADITVATTLRSGYQGARSVVMTLGIAETDSGAAVTITQASATGTIAETELPAGDHGYFDALVARGDCIKSWHLRTYDQVRALRSHGTQPDSYTMYMYGTDTDPKAQDAAKCWIPPFGHSLAMTTAAAGVDATSLRVPVTTVTGGGGETLTHTTDYKFDSPSMSLASEIVRTGPSSAYRDTTTVEVLLQEPRAKYGTTAVAHAGGAKFYKAACSLYDQIEMPVRYPSGSTYVTIFDTYFTKSWMRTNVGAYKAWRAHASGIYLECQVRFGGDVPGVGSPITGYDDDLHVGAATLRCYGSLRGTSTDNNPCKPMAGQFIIWPERWTRWWLKMELGTSPDFMYASLWCADTVQEPTLVNDRNAYATRASYDEWKVELNTSTNTLTGGRTTDYPDLGITAFRDLVTYTRNHVVLQDTSDVDLASLLVKPSA